MDDHHLPPTTYHLPLTTYHLLLPNYYVVPSAHYSLFTTSLYRCRQLTAFSQRKSTDREILFSFRGVVGRFTIGREWLRDDVGQMLPSLDGQCERLMSHVGRHLSGVGCYLLETPTGDVDAAPPQIYSEGDDDDSNQVKLPSLRRITDMELAGSSVFTLVCSTPHTCHLTGTRCTPPSPHQHPLHIRYHTAVRM